jgi:inhibitor of KinA sporulation pathway (predicted exonuclease)
MKNFNLVNVVDHEFSCYRNGVFPPGERKEIIEGGLCVVDLRKLEIIRRVSIPVVPTMSSISEYCTELTGWTHDLLKKRGVSYAEYCRRVLVKLGARNRLVVTDSSGELAVVREQCALMGVDYPYGNDTINIAAWFAIVTGQRTNLSLEEMLAYMGLQFEGPPHRADWDAHNIARLLIALIQSGRLGLLLGRSNPLAEPDSSM